MVRNGVERAFCVSGQYYLAALDALHQSPVAVRLLRVPFFPKPSKHLIGIAITYVSRCTRRDNHHTHRSACCQTRCSDSEARLTQDFRGGFEWQQANVVQAQRPAARSVV